MSDRVFDAVIVIGLMLLAYGWGYIHGSSDEKYHR